MVMLLLSNYDTEKDELMILWQRQNAQCVICIQYTILA